MYASISCCFLVRYFLDSWSYWVKGMCPPPSFLVYWSYSVQVCVLIHTLFVDLIESKVCVFLQAFFVDLIESRYVYFSELSLLVLLSQAMCPPLSFLVCWSYSVQVCVFIYALFVDLIESRVCVLPRAFFDDLIESRVCVLLWAFLFVDLIVLNYVSSTEAFLMIDLIRYFSLFKIFYMCSIRTHNLQDSKPCFSY